MQALFGQKLSAEINLVAQVLILVGLWIGFYFARKKQFKRHQAMQTTLVLANSVLILLVMVTSFYNYVIRGGSTTGVVASLMILHGTVGLIAELTGIYLLLRMNTKLLPASLRVKNYKLVMRTLLGLWTLVAVGGFVLYYFRYVYTPPANTKTTPAVMFLQEAGDVGMHVDEMQAAQQRGNLSTAKRHAEHVINLVEGKKGTDYGDLDGDGVVQDPGDGTGVLNYLDQVLAEGKQYLAAGPETAQLKDQFKAGLQKVIDDARAVIQAGDASAVTAQVADAASLAESLTNDQNGMSVQLLLALDLHPSQLPGAATAAPPGGTAVNVLMKNYEFVPKNLKIKKGATVTFFNQDADKHTVTSDTGLFNSGDLDSGQSFTFTFNDTGVFPYFCVFHGDKGGVDMAGVVEVTP